MEDIQKPLMFLSAASRNDREALNKILQLHFRVIVAKDGDELLSLLGNHRLPDIILLDMSLIHPSGLTLLQRISTNSRWCTIPVAVIPRPGSNVSEKSLLALGVKECVNRPFQAEWIASRLLRLAEQRMLIVKQADLEMAQKQTAQNGAQNLLKEQHFVSQMFAFFNRHPGVRYQLVVFTLKQQPQLQTLLSGKELEDISQKILVQMRKLAGRAGFAGQPANSIYAVCLPQEFLSRNELLPLICTLLQQHFAIELSPIFGSCDLGRRDNLAESLQHAIAACQIALEQNLRNLHWSPAINDRLLQEREQISDFMGCIRSNAPLIGFVPILDMATRQTVGCAVRYGASYPVCKEGRPHPAHRIFFAQSHHWKQLSLALQHSGFISMAKRTFVLLNSRSDSLPEDFSLWLPLPIGGLFLPQWVEELAKLKEKYPKVTKHLCLMLDIKDCDAALPQLKVLAQKLQQTNIPVVLCGLDGTDSVEPLITLAPKEIVLAEHLWQQRAENHKNAVFLLQTAQKLSAQTAACGLETPDITLQQLGCRHYMGGQEQTPLYFCDFAAQFITSPIAEPPRLMPCPPNQVTLGEVGKKHLQKAAQKQVLGKRKTVLALVAQAHIPTVLQLPKDAYQLLLANDCREAITLFAEHPETDLLMLSLEDNLEPSFFFLAERFSNLALWQLPMIGILTEDNPKATDLAHRFGIDALLTGQVTSLLLQQKAEELLLDQHRMRQIITKEPTAELPGAAALVLLKQGQAKLSYISPDMKQMTGFAAPELMSVFGGDMLCGVASCDRKRFASHLLDCFDSNAPIDICYWQICKGGKLSRCRLQGRFFKALHDGALYLASFTDVEALYQAKEILERNHLQLPEPLEELQKFPAEFQ